MIQGDLVGQKFNFGTIIKKIWNPTNIFWKKHIWHCEWSKKNPYDVSTIQVACLLQIPRSSTIYQSRRPENRKWVVVKAVWSPAHIIMLLAQYKANNGWGSWMLVHHSPSIRRWLYGGCLQLGADNHTWLIYSRCTHGVFIVHVWQSDVSSARYTQYTRR